MFLEFLRNDIVEEHKSMKARRAEQRNYPSLKRYYMKESLTHKCNLATPPLRCLEKIIIIKKDLGMLTIGNFIE